MLALKVIPSVLGAVAPKPKRPKRFRILPALILLLLGFGLGAWVRDSADPPIDKARCLLSVFR